MRKIFLLLTIILNATIMNAQDQDPWSVYMTPSSVHHLLATYEGDFKMEITMSMEAGKEPLHITVKSEHNMLLGGRFLEMKQHGDMMGMDYHSILILGYNNIDQKIALTTMTNMGTGTLSLLGDWNEATQSAILFGQLINPVTKNATHIRQVITFVDQDTILIESFDQEGESPERKTVQYKLTRSS
jgi:hypothetical protein